jgi:AraC-like DNA-binding protein
MRPTENSALSCRNGTKRIAGKSCARLAAEVSRGKQPAPFWQRFDINRIEDLGNAVLGAELEAMQMAGPPARGSLAFAARDGVIFSTGLIRGRASMRGSLSQDAITLAVGLKFGLGSRLWLNPVADGAVGVFLPGESCDALLTDGSLYLAANLSQERLEREAASEGLLLDRRSISRTGLHSRPIVRQALICLRSTVARIHRQATVSDDGIGRAVLRTVIQHLAQPPVESAGRTDPVGRGSIVHRAQEFIRANLDGPISLDAVAGATGTSRRTLARVFAEVLEDTPANHIRRLRLHRIRRDLVRDAASGRTIHEIAAAWGIGEPGRMAAWYRDIFGEYPNETRSIHSGRRQHEAAL